MIYFDAGNISVTEEPQQINVSLREAVWQYNETQRPDYFNMYGE